MIKAKTSGKWLIIPIIAFFFFAPALVTAKDQRPDPGKNPAVVMEAKAKKSEIAKPAAKDQKKEEAIIAATDKDINKADIFVGQVSDSIANPRCVDITALLAVMPECREAEKQRLEHFEARYWILLSKANDHMRKVIWDYAAANNVAFLCKREKLLPLLRKLDQYKEKSDQELIAGFDITEMIIEDFEQKNPSNKKPK